MKFGSTSDGHTFLKGLLQNSRYSTKSSGNDSSTSKASSSGAVSSTHAAGLLPHYHGAMDTFRTASVSTSTDAHSQIHSASSSASHLNDHSKGIVPHWVEKTGDLNP
ncbi:MAG: hypothetical protein M1813_000824 [Trichoglossum hirsutum]|nr:MAG: hypothetical protein M1813_000824 [Trichoglossum hirsutum]